MTDILGILFLGLFGALIAGAALAIPALIAPHRSTDVTTPYESGMKPIGSARLRFSVKFYLVALLFIIFDVEVIYLYPWAIRLRDLGWTGMIEMLVFMGILGAGYLYILRKGALEWD